MQGTICRIVNHFRGRWLARKLSPKVGVGMLILVSGVFISVGTGIEPAFAAPPKPITDWGYYVDSTSTVTAYDHGCSDGTYDANHGDADRLAYLDFGGQVEGLSGAKLINGTVVSNATIEGIAEQYASGYWTCTGSDTASWLTLAMGTNNSYWGVDVDGGKTWAADVAVVQNWVTSHIGQVVVYGGNDIEPSWSPPTAAENWANGYNGASVGLYLNYGSADGCPTSTIGGSCNNGWHVWDVWDVSWGVSAAIVAPQIYYSAQAEQWTQISRFGAQQNGAVGYTAPLDEYDLDNGTYTPVQAWTQFWNDLNAWPASSQTPGYSLEAHDE